MNQVELIGRLVRDVNMRTAKNEEQTAVALFTLAVDRNTKEADFISCKAFGRTAEFMEQYTRKGQRIGVTGRIQTGSYEGKKGETVYTMDVIVSQVFFADGKIEEVKPEAEKPLDKAETKKPAESNYRRYR